MINKNQLDQAIEYVANHTAGSANGFPENYFCALLNKSVSDINRRTLTVKTKTEYGYKENYFEIVSVIAAHLPSEIRLHPLGSDYGVLACKDSLAVGYFNFDYGTGSSKIYLLGDSNFISSISEVINRVCDTTKASVVTVFENSYNDDIIPAIKPLYLSEGPDYDIFYPYFNKTIKETYDEFMASSANVMLLIGPPGTGKSNYLEKTIRHTNFENRVVKIDEAGILQNKNLIKRLRDLPRGSKVFVEDADLFISKRTDGNQQMSGLLNAVNGIGRSDLKIWVSTNLPDVRSVDRALIRPGRLFDIREFRLLTIAEITEIRKSMGLPEIDFGSEETLTLAEAINGKIQSKVNDSWLN